VVRGAMEQKLPSRIWGSIWDERYDGRGNVTEILGFGRIAGQNAAVEKPQAQVRSGGSRRRQTCRCRTREAKWNTCRMTVNFATRF
jgi:hypothetical protein